MSRVNQRLNGLNPLSYLGFDAVQPNDFIKNIRDPLTSDFNNFYIGTWWLNTQTNSLFYLASVIDGSATWVEISSQSGDVITFTGNTGGPVPPTASNTDFVGDGTSITIVGNPGTSTLTLSAILSNVIQTITGDSGGAVSPDSNGNINIIGQDPIIVTDDPATSTVTISHKPPVINSYQTQSGIAQPAAGVLTINGANGLSTTGSGNTVTIIASGDVSSSYITSPATGTAVPADGVITFAAGSNTTISASGSSITINNTGAGPSGGPAYSTGPFTPVFTNLSVTSYVTQFGQYIRIGNIVFINLLIEANIMASSGPGTITISGMPFPTNGAKMQSQNTMDAILNSAITPSSGVFKYPTMWLNAVAPVAATQWSLLGGPIPQTGTFGVGTAGMGTFISLSASGFYFI